MIATLRNRAVKITALLLLLCLLSWNLGIGIIPGQALQVTEAPLPTETSTPTLAEIVVSETPPVTDVPEFEGANTEDGDSTARDTSQRPLPLIFKAGTYALDEIVVRFKPSTSPARVQACFQATGVEVQAQIEELNIFVLTSVSGEVADTFYQVMDCAGVMYVEPNFLVQVADTTPNDPLRGLQYGLEKIRAPQGWDLSTGSSSVTIAIVDTGVDLNHPDLAGKLVPGYDFVNQDAIPQDDHGHGTHVAGIAAASSNNGIGVAGVSWGARIMPIKVLSAKGGGTDADTAAGVVWAVDHGAQVINLSLGGTEASSVMEDAINYAHRLGAVIVAAAGNYGNHFVLYPARYPNVIAVAKIDNNDQWAGSNYGPEMDLSAPGTAIYSTYPGGYSYLGGSSMSTGFVSGLAAVLMGIPGNQSPDLIEYEMEATAKDIQFTGWDEYTGAGLIQMDSAIQLALQSIPAQVDSSGPRLGAGPGPGPLAPTLTPIPTWTPSATPVSLESTTTSTPETPSTVNVTSTTASATQSILGTSTEKPSEVEIQGESGVNPYILPCSGALLILLGIMLIWLVSRKQKEL